MFSALIALAALPLTLVHGLTISNPTETVTSTGPITISWTTQSGDPSTFSIELINQSFNSQYAIANNVDSSLGSLSLTLPQIPAEDGYTIELVNISNINDVYAQTSTFSVSEPVSSSASASSTGSASESGSASASASGSASVSGSASASGSVSATASGSTSRASSASASASGSSTRASSTSPSASSAAATASSSAFNAASRVQIGGAGVLAAVLAWVVAL